MTSSSRRVYEQVRRAILHGEFAPGTRRQVVITDPSPSQLAEALLMRDALEPVFVRQAAGLLIPHAAGQYLAEDALRRLRGLARITVRDIPY